MRRNRRKKGGALVGKLLMLVLVLVLLAAALAAQLPVSLPGEREPCGDYESWMSETLSAEALLTDVALPGSHNSLSAAIGFTSAADDAAEGTLLTNPLLRGLAVRQTRTQALSVTEQLDAGVRYLDLQVSRCAEDGTWYGVNTFRSQTLRSALDEVYTFLLTHPGEVVVLDFSRCQDSREADGLAGAAGTEELYALLEASGLTNLMPEGVSLASATYGSLTENGTRPAALVLLDGAGEHTNLLPRADSVTDLTCDTDQTDRLLDSLNQSAQQLEAGIHGESGFRTQYAVLTFQPTASGVLGSLAGWSCLDRAETLHQSWLAEVSAQQSGGEDAVGWLETMPVVLMDNAAVGETGRQVMELILVYNRALS